MCVSTEPEFRLDQKKTLYGFLLRTKMTRINILYMHSLWNRHGPVILKRSLKKDVTYRQVSALFIQWIFIMRSYLGFF